MHAFAGFWCRLVLPKLDGAIPCIPLPAARLRIHIQIQMATRHMQENCTWHFSKTVLCNRTMPVRPRLSDAALRIWEYACGSPSSFKDLSSGGGLLIVQPSSVTAALPATRTAVPFTRSLLVDPGGRPRSVKLQPAWLFQKRSQIRILLETPSGNSDERRQRGYATRHTLPERPSAHMPSERYRIGTRRGST